MKRTRFITTLCLVALITGFTGCSKDESNVISLKTTEKTLYYSDEYQIEATSTAAITYVVENEYHANVSETGLITAKYVGETNISLSNGEDSKTFKVVVKPKSNLYPEPNVKFGDSKSALIAKYGKPNSETSTSIAYTNYSSAAPILMFLFDSSGKMNGYSIMIKSTYTSILADFFIERYMTFSMTDDMFIFINGLSSHTATMVIGLELYNTSYWQAIYIPNPSKTQSPSLRSGANLEIKDEFDEILKGLL